MQINPGFFALKDTEVKGKGINFSEAFNSCAKVVALEMFLAALKSKSFNMQFSLKNPITLLENYSELREY